jgi:hypothetical protein
MSVQLRRDFARSVRTQLDRYPVWEPGARFELGDYGVLRDKTLHTLGNIRAFDVEFSVVSGSETPYQFQSKGISVIEGHASGSVEPSGLDAPLRASLELQFGEEHGIFIKAPRSRVIQIGELREVALKLRRSDRWKFGWKLVTEMREVNPATIIMGSSANTTLKVEGEADLLEQFKIGGLKAGTAISFTGEAALQVVGVEGPIFLDLCYLPRFFGEDINRAAVPVEELPTEPFVRLGTQWSIQDDDER